MEPKPSFQASDEKKPQQDPAGDLGQKTVDKGADPQLGRKEINRGPTPGAQRGVISEQGRKEIDKSEEAKAENAGRKEIDRTDAV